MFGVNQILAVGLLAAASMTAFQDLQATAWRDVAIGEIPEIVVYRNPQGTFTRCVTAGFIIALVIMFLVRGRTSSAVPYYGIGVFMPIMVMGFAIRRHILHTYTGNKRKWGSLAASFAALLAATIFIGQIDWKAAGGARDEFLVGLPLEVLEAGKPAFEVVLFPTQEIIDDHNYTAAEIINKVANSACQGRPSATKGGNAPKVA